MVDRGLYMDWERNFYQMLHPTGSWKATSGTTDNDASQGNWTKRAVELCHHLPGSLIVRDLDVHLPDHRCLKRKVVT